MDVEFWLDWGWSLREVGLGAGITEPGYLNFRVCFVVGFCICVCPDDHAGSRISLI